MKRIFCFVVIITMLFSLFTATVFAENTDDLQNTPLIVLRAGGGGSGGGGSGGGGGAKGGGGGKK